MLGPPGTGESHLAVTLGLEAVEAGRSVYFSTLAELASSLARAERDGQLRERIRYYARVALLIIDEIGYLPLQAGGANLFFQLLNAHYERGAMILACNHGFGEAMRGRTSPRPSCCRLRRSNGGAVGRRGPSLPP